MTSKKLSLSAVAIAGAIALAANAFAKTPAELDDLEIAHVAYTADLIDIRYAHLALGISKNPAIREFAKTMIRDHTTVNALALALLKKLKVSAKDNFLSKQLHSQADGLVNEMRQLSGKAFDMRYASNELSYHKAVNSLVGKTFIPNIENAEVKSLFKDALAIFTVHQKHAEKMVTSLRATN